MTMTETVERPGTPAPPDERTPQVQRQPVLLRKELFRDRPGTAALIVVSMLASVAGTLLLPLLVSDMIGTVQAGRPAAGSAVRLVLVGLGSAVAGALAAHLVARLGERLTHRLRVRVIEHSLRMRAGAVERMGSGDLAGRLGADAMTVKAAVDAVPVQLPIAVLTFVGTVVIMALIDPVLLVVTLGGFSVAAVLVGLVIVGLKARYRLLQDDLGALMKRFVATLDALTVIKSTRSENRQAAELGRYVTRLRATGVNAAKLESLVVPTINLGQQIALIAVLIGGGARLVGGSLTLGEFVGFLLYLLQMAAPLMMAASALTTVQAGLTARSRFDAVLLSPLESDDTVPADARPVDDRGPAGMPAAELVDVRADYGAGPVLDGVSLAVPAVGLTSLVGPSGSGKTTVLRLVDRLIVAGQGSVRVLGSDVRHQDLEQLRSRIAYVDQRCTLVPGSVRTNLEIGSHRTCTDDELYAALARVGLDVEVRRMPEGLDTELSGGRDLSGGQAQRLAIARAVLSDARLVLLDEPTSALDAGNEDRLRRLITDIARDRAVLVVAHRISTVRDARHVIVMEAGRVVAEGTHGALLAGSSLYSELVDLQMITPAVHEVSATIGVRP